MRPPRTLGGRNKTIKDSVFNRGKANGAFAYYVLTEEGNTEFFARRGNLRDGIADAPVIHYRNGETYEQYENLEEYSWWPDWPEKN